MNNCTDLLKDLIRIPSVERESANQAIAFCRNWLTEQGLTVREYRHEGYDSLVAEIGQGGKTLVLNGHVDVVSGKEGQFTPYEADGRLYGRGAADMKAGVAAMMTVIAELQQEVLPCKVQLQLVSDEEIGGLRGTRHLVAEGCRGDFVICGEPTQLGLGIQAKGILQLDIPVAGRAAHGSRPWEGDNAIEKAFGWFQQIRALPFSQEAATLYAGPSINLAKIQAGDVYNKVPDYCLMSLDIRFLPQQQAAEIIRQIEAITGPVMVHAIGEPVRTPEDSPYVRRLAAVASQVLARQARIFGQHGSADTRFFAPHGIPAIEFGPCGANWHGDDEYVELKSVAQYQTMLRDFIRTFC